MKRNISPVAAACILIFLITVSCTFDYGEVSSSEREMPDLVMKKVEYVRVRSADPIARFQADLAERYERQGVMKLENLFFEQYGERGEEVNALGQAGNASVNIESGDIFMNNGVRVEVESEDIIIETFQLDWKDAPRILSSGENDEVNIFQQNGTHFIGIGLWVDTRKRTWEFLGAASGTYIYEEEDENDQQEIEKVSDADISGFISEAN